MPRLEEGAPPPRSKLTIVWETSHWEGINAHRASKHPLSLERLLLQKR